MVASATARAPRAGWVVAKMPVAPEVPRRATTAGLQRGQLTANQPITPVAMLVRRSWGWGLVDWA